MEIVEKKGTSCRRMPQTKILEGWTKDEMRICEALFKGVSSQFGPRPIEKCFTNPHLIFGFSFQNLRLGGVKLGRSCMHRRQIGIRGFRRLSGMLVVFYKPILAILLQRKRLIARMNHGRFVVFCTPILAMLLQSKPQTVRRSSMQLACVVCCSS